MDISAVIALTYRELLPDLRRVAIRQRGWERLSKSADDADRGKNHDLGKAGETVQKLVQVPSLLRLCSLLLPARRDADVRKSEQAFDSCPFTHIISLYGMTCILQYIAED
jgi:hypothetical protein